MISAVGWEHFNEGDAMSLFRRRRRPAKAPWNPGEDPERLPFDEWFRHELAEDDTPTRNLSEPPLPEGKSYQDFDPNEIWHMAFIQNVIKRMANCSFLVKGASLTVVALVAKFLATSFSEEIARQGTLRLAPLVGLFALPLATIAVFFGLIDAYYLWQERAYRELYKAVCAGDGCVPAFSMNPWAVISTKPPGRLRWLGACFSRAVWLFHGAVFGIVLLAGYVYFDYAAQGLLSMTIQTLF